MCVRERAVPESKGGWRKRTASEASGSRVRAAVGAKTKKENGTREGGMATIAEEEQGGQEEGARARQDEKEGNGENGGVGQGVGGQKGGRGKRSGAGRCVEVEEADADAEGEGESEEGEEEEWDERALGEELKRFRAEMARERERERREKGGYVEPKLDRRRPAIVAVGKETPGRGWSGLQVLHPKP